MTEAASELIVIGVCTYMRPLMLAKLLDACSRLQTPDGVTLGVLIVDNDEKQSARKTVEAASSLLPIPVHYRVEAARGIANARNRVLTETLVLNADYLAMIDDDEMMRPDWLSVLFKTLLETKADAVGGPVYWDLPDDTPAWQHALTTSPKYEARYGGRKKQKPRIYPSTNNVLMKSRIFRDLGLRFDTRFGLAAGEDLDFFIRARAAGAVYAFAPGAAILEHVPPSRLTLRWRFSRWINFAGVNVKMHRLHNGSRSAWRHYLPRALPGLLSGPAFVLISPLFGPPTLLRGLKHLGGAIGMLKGLMGHVADEYRTVHGN